MKFEKKHWMMLIIGILALVAIWYFFFKKKTTESSYNAALPLIGGESGYTKNQLTNGRNNFESGFAKSGSKTGVIMTLVPVNARKFTSFWNTTCQCAGGETCVDIVGGGKGCLAPSA